MLKFYMISWRTYIFLRYCIFFAMIAYVLVLILLKYNQYKTSVNNKPRVFNSSQSFKFVTPSNFIKESVPTSDGRVIENWKLTENNNSPTLIYVTLISSTKDLDDFEPVHERRNNPIQYLEEIGRMKDRWGILFRTIDQKERDIFFSNKTQILVIYYIAKTTNPSEETKFLNFLDNITWQ